MEFWMVSACGGGALFNKWGYIPVLLIILLLQAKKYTPHPCTTTPLPSLEDIWVSKCFSTKVVSLHGAVNTEA